MLNVMLDLEVKVDVQTWIYHRTVTSRPFACVCMTEFPRVVRWGDNSVAKNTGVDSGAARGVFPPKHKGVSAWLQRMALESPHHWGDVGRR